MGRWHFPNPQLLNFRPTLFFCVLSGYLHERPAVSVLGISRPVKGGLRSSADNWVSWRNNANSPTLVFDRELVTEQDKVVRGRQIEAKEDDGGVSKALSILRWHLRKVDDNTDPYIRPILTHPSTERPYTAENLGVLSPLVASVSSRRGS